MRVQDEALLKGGKPKRVRRKCVAVRCMDCEASFRARTLEEGMACPKCRSTHLTSLATPGGAVDYILADRSQGTTAADVTFGRWAKWCGHITPNQYNTAVHRQNSELQEQGKTRPIHEVLMSLGHLDREQAVGLLRFLALPRPNIHDTDFVARLLSRGKAAEEKVRKVCELQLQISRERNEICPVGQMLLQKRIISEAQFLEVLREQADNGVGSLKVARDMTRAPVKESPGQAALRWVRENPRTGLKIAALIVLCMVAWQIWVRQFREEPVFVYGLCGKCQAASLIEWTESTTWPGRCPRCRKDRLGYAVKCRNGHIFRRGSPYSHEVCPVCGADRGRPLMEQDVVKEESKREVGDSIPARRR